MTNSTAIDDATSAAVQDLLAAAKQGRLQEAVGIGQRALDTAADPASINATLGVVLCRSGQIREGIPYLQAAHEMRPADIAIAFNLAAALAEIEDYRAGFRVLSDELAHQDKTLQLLRMRGFFAQMLGAHAIAISAFTEVLDAIPSDWESWNDLGNAQASNGELRPAIQSFKRAAELQPSFAPIRLNLARALREEGDAAGAEAELRSIAADFPHDPQPLVDLFDLLRSDIRSEQEARQALQSAVDRDPDNLDLPLLLGRWHLERFDVEDAERIFRSVIQKEPANESAFLGLAVLFDRHRPHLLAELVDEATEARLPQAALNLLRAYADRRAKRSADGLEALANVPEDYEPAISSQIQGQLLDSMGEYDRAFAAFAKMNDALSLDDSEPLKRARNRRSRLRQVTDHISAEWLQSWAAPRVEAVPAPVFLVGFPRSGTTLLDTMLMGHPDVEVMEERPVIRRLEREIGGFDAITNLDEEQLRQAQSRYFQIAADYAAVQQDRLLIDKGPLLLNDAPLIYRLFPNAQFILAIRHPVDAVLSCYMAGFRLNSSMANFLRLDTAAEFYDLTFGFWEKARSLMPLNVHEIHYERLVQDPEIELKSVTDTLGLAWNPAVLDHEATAQQRGVIKTASYAQVTEPLYSRSVDRWHNYRKHVEPILPILEPWAVKFGYTV